MSVPPFPEPPALHPSTLPTWRLPSGEPLYRIHGVGKSAVHFNKTQDFRFNAPVGEFGVLYAALQPEGAFVETFCRALGTGPTTTERQLSLKGLSELRHPTALELVDLTGPGLVTLHIDGRIFAGEDYSIAQRWSRWLWEHSNLVHGILYCSRHDTSQHCVALFSERCPAPSSTSVATPLSADGFRKQLGALLTRYNVALL